MLRPARLLARSLPASVLAIVALGLAVPATALGQPAAIVVFGDSLSDSGNGFALVRESATPPHFTLNALLIPTAPYARGGHHLADGATWIEQLARPLGLARSVHPAFRGASPHAMNFAVGTARARTGGADPHLSLQVAAFLQKAGGVARPDALYVIQIGSNDVRDALAAASAGADPLPILQAAAAAVASSIATLYQAGARQFLVWNVPDIGLTPAAALLDAQVPGTAAAATLLTQTFNMLLSAGLLTVLPLPGIAIVPFDAFALITAIHGDPGAFGLTNVTEACLTPDVPPFACSDPDEYLFWDGIHPTRAVHAIIAAHAATLLGL